ncbi:MAG: hypothetical protein PHE51_12655 [Eubacteriales bacterium]|nr:hypothetical protein [Eubacteriales bacterium]
MKVVDAFWEKRNLGLTAIEITLDKDDQIEQVSEQLSLSIVKCDYVVVKLPVGRVDISFLLSELGFTFIESMYHMSHNLQPMLLNEYQSDIVGDMSLISIKDNDLEFILDKIRTGIFNTDRVSLDPFFSMDQAASRYVEWLKDELKRGTEIFNVVYNRHKAGFIVLKKTGDGYHNFLDGIYDEFTGKGFAVCMRYLLNEEARKRGSEFLSTNISSNNIASLKSMFKCGFSITDTTYVFVKHNLGKKDD